MTLSILHLLLYFPFSLSHVIYIGKNKVILGKPIPSKGLGVGGGVCVSIKSLQIFLLLINALKVQNFWWYFSIYKTFEETLNSSVTKLIDSDIRPCSPPPWPPPPHSTRSPSATPALATPRLPTEPTLPLVLPLQLTTLLPLLLWLPLLPLLPLLQSLPSPPR